MKLATLNTPGPVAYTFSDLQVDALVRVLPGRRWVFRGHWRGQAVYAKLFAGRHAARYAQRDATGARYLCDRGIRTPTLLWQGPLIDDATGVEALVFAAVPHAINAAEQYQLADPQTRLTMLHALVDMLATQHAQGLVQTDLHLKNFLIAEDTVWAIDGDGIRQRTLSVKQAHKQLAELLSKLSLEDQIQWTEPLLQTYLRRRAWSSSISSQQVARWAQQFKAQEVHHYVTQKIFRTCSDVIWQQDCRSAQACSVVGGLHVTDIPALEVAMHVGQRLKTGNTCTVVQTQLQDKPVVIKRYNIKHLWHALSRAWRPSRAALSWQNAHRLLYYGMHTPQPLLMFEQRYWGMRGRAYFVAAYSPWPDIKTFFATATDPVLRAQAMQSLALLCYQWSLLGIVHGDLKSSNLQVTDLGDIVVLDLDSMRQIRHAQRAQRGHARDLRRLLQNWKQDSSLYNALVASLYQHYKDPAPLLLAGLTV